MKHQRINELAEKCVQLNKFQKNFLESSISYLTPTELEEFETYIHFLQEEGKSLDDLAQAYNHIVKEMVREQAYFMKHGKYRYSTLQEVESSVYYDETYMQNYMYGLALTTFLWPNHIQMCRWFGEYLPRQLKGDYLEIGPGHGYFLMSAMQRGSFDHYDAIDLSPSSIKLTQDILESGRFGDFKNYNLTLGNFFDIPDNQKYSAIVMGEVIEHVERPEDFLKKVHAITTPDSFIYISTAINSPAVDHIYLFEHNDQVVKLFNGEGFDVKQQLVLPYTGKTIEESYQKRLPINSAYILEKRG